MVWITIPILAFATTMIVCEIFRRSVRRRFVKEREQEPLTDDAFCAAMSVDADDRVLWLAVRRVVAGMCGVSAEFIRPEDPLGKLWRMTFDGPDQLDVVFRLEREFGARIDGQRLFATGEGLFAKSKSVREFGEFLVGRLREMGTAADL